MTRIATTTRRTVAAAALIALGLTASMGNASAGPSSTTRSYGPHVVPNADCGLSEGLGLQPDTLNFGAACFDAHGSAVSVIIKDASGLNTASTVHMRSATGTLLHSVSFCTRIDNVPLAAGTTRVVVVNDNPAGQALSTAGVCNGRLAASTAGEITAIFS